MALPGCDYILHCSHKGGLPARQGENALQARVPAAVRQLRALKAAPEDVEIEAIEPVERASRVLQAPQLALAEAQGEDRIENPSKEPL